MASGFRRSASVAPAGGVAVFDRGIFTGTGSYAFGRNNTVVLDKAVGDPTTLTLPDAPCVGVEYDAADGRGDADVNNITVEGNGHTINGMPSQTISSAFGVLALLFVGTGYVIVRSS